MADDPRAAMDALLDRLVDVLSGVGGAAQVQARRQLDEITRGIADVTVHVRAAGASTAKEPSRWD